MASEKNSRLINLVIALLATKKFLTKPQIFKAVAGYDGNTEATDRMFERDKEELRALGIEIEMKAIDPLFEDEIGYRIRPERYRLDLGPLSTEEVQLLALAAEVWRESVFEDLALSSARRLESLGINADFAEIPIANSYKEAPSNLLDLLAAIQNQKKVNFEYLNLEDQPEKKTVSPYGIYSRKERWYLYAEDFASGIKKSYRLDRIVSEVKATKEDFQPKEFAIPKTHFPSINAVVEVRRDCAPDISLIGREIESNDEWIKYQVEFESENSAVACILRNTPNARLLEPISLVASVTKSLERLVNLHEH
jgi:proteasome accessory factor B